MGVNVTRVVKFIRKGDKGSDAVRYWLIPSVSSVSMADVEGGDGKPTPSSVSCRLVKQVGDDTPTTITNAASAGLTMSYAFKRNDNVVTPSIKYSGSTISVPTNIAYRAIEFYLYRGSQLIDTATIAIVCDGQQGEPGEPGQDGEDAISIKVSPQTLVLKRNGKAQNFKVYVDLFKGDTQIPYGDASQGEMLCSTLTSNDRVITDGLRWNFGVENTRFYYSFIYTGATDINIEIPFTVTYNGKKYPEKIVTQTIADGDRGPALRGPQAWSDCATGYNFQCGAEGEAWKDVVLYGNNYYSCVKSHAKAADNYPGSTADQSNGYWQLGDKIELVATKILLASYALVKNLGVESIDMRDAAGNILFQAKDGNVTCKTGTFENIKVSGDITAEYLNLKLSTAAHYEDTPVLSNGSICVQASGIILPELPAGTARSMRVLNSLMSRTTPSDLVLKPASANVLISKSLSEMGAVNSNVTLSSCGYNGNKYMELIGIHRTNSDYTVWLLSEMNNGISEK